MTFTGQLGTANSSLGNIVLGYPGIASSVPVTTSTVPLPDLQLIVNFGPNKRILNGVGANSVTDSIHWGSLMPGGHHTLEARIADTERSAFPSVYRYGATVTLRERSTTAEGGQVLWQGYLRTPIANDDGTADLVCNGWHQLLQERDEALMWQDRYYGDWQPADADGFTLGGNSDAIDASVNNAALSFKVAKGQDINADESSRLVWYFADATNSQVLPRRVALSMYKNRSVDNANYLFALERFDGPNQKATRQRQYNFDTEISNNQTGDNPTNVTVVITGPQPVIALALFRSGPGTASTDNSLKIIVRNLRVNDLAPGDTYLSSQVLSDLASKMGFSTAITATTDNILPLFWTDGTWWDLADYLAMAENVKWGVWESNPNPQLFFQPWGTGSTTWTANGYSSSANVIAKLQPDDEVYNVVDVSYRQGNSVRIRHVRVPVSPDPFAGLTPQRTRTYRLALSDTQPDDTLATAIATRLAVEFATEQLAGTVVASYLSIGSTAHTVYECRAGDLLTLPDYPGGSKTVRIYGVDHRDDGPSTLTIGRVPSRLDRMLFWSEQKKRRKGVMAS